ncbi:MAG: benzoyl-CoA 2,3-epoxidase subunit BoxB [Planctomycetota bacterium]|nr:benzoyl-CoA 2,3-epoxidase subunit BoxB [Planctomycetota bacterium]
MSISSERIPNNVDLSSDTKLQKALEKWQPAYLDWWQEVGPQGFDNDEIYLRTAISVEPSGWAHFDHVKTSDYRWGIFLAPPQKDRTIPCGDNHGKAVWNEVPGAFRKELRRIIVTQADTEPASVEQQRLLGQTAPSLYDMRNLFQVNVEEGRHLWAMVYILHKYFGRDGREEADELLARRSGDADSPRILEAFNKPCRDWLAFFSFTTFTDRDGKYQLGALVESAFDPLSRTCRFMLTEEAHHMYVGQTGIGRVVRKTAEVMKQDPNEEVTRHGAIPLEIIQKYLNEWYSASLDLFGGEDSSNSANYFAAGLKGRWNETTDEKIKDHMALEGEYVMEMPLDDGGTEKRKIPLRRAMNLVLRDSYVEDCVKVIGKWNKVLEESQISQRLTLPHERFNRGQGIYSERGYDTSGAPITDGEWEARRGEFLPTEEDYAYVESLMKPVAEPGKFASWIAPPPKGLNGQPIDFDYVRLMDEKSWLGG